METSEELGRTPAMSLMIEESLQAWLKPTEK
jgi:hypothetical protein